MSNSCKKSCAALLILVCFALLQAGTARAQEANDQTEPSPSMVAQPEVPSDLADETGKSPDESAPVGEDVGPPGLQSNEAQPDENLAACFDDGRKHAFKYLDEALDRLKLARGRSAVELRAALAAGQALNPAEQKCVGAYDKLYAKAQIEIKVALGYDNYDDGDGDDTVMDGATKGALIRRLARPCTKSGVSACGFAYDSDDQSLSKLADGPDGIPRVIRVTLRSSSLSMSDEYNRLRSPAAQDESTKSTRKYFLDGFGSSDILIYAGHSRDGGGPSFGPPRLVRERMPECQLSPELEHLKPCVRGGLEVDYPWYHNHRDDERDMLDALAGADPAMRPSMVVLASCYSGSHFARKLHRISPQTGLFVTRSLLGKRSMVEMVYDSIDAVTRQSCRREWLAPLVRSGLRDSDGKRIDGNPSMIGFF